MASVSLVSSPQAPVLDKNMTDSELAGDEREDGELEDGEIDDEGIGIEEDSKEHEEVTEDRKKEKEPKDKEPKEKEKEKDDKAHWHSRKRSKKTRDKRRSKKRRHDRQKHHSPSSSSSSDSYDSDYDRPERPKNRRSQGSNRESNGQSSQHGRDSKRGHSKSPQGKSGECGKYSDYSDDYEEDEDYGADIVVPPSQGRGRHAKEQLKRGNMRGMKQQFGQRGRGRGCVPGRGRGLLNKNKKLKGKSWLGRGRGRGGEQDGGPPEGKHSGFQKKRPIMSKEFISQHTVEHNGRYICKYFLEGRCIKGEQCKFEHELVVPDKKKELCKFYLQGVCSKGEHCIYMHSEYPCKFFHTGAKCYQGDNCKFSHEALTDVAKELLDKIISTEEEIAHEDELELENLRKQGIAPLPKPPPGVGLLPTPGHNSPQDGVSSQGGKKIPSLFEIKVQPTVDLAHKIGLSGTRAQFQGDGQSQFSGGPEDRESGPITSPGAPAIPPAGSPGPPGHPVGSPGPQNPPVSQQPAHGFLAQPSVPIGPPPPFQGNRPAMSPQMNPHMGMQRPPFPAMPDLHLLQSLFPFPPPVGQSPVEFLNNFLRNQAMGPGDPSLAFVQNIQQQMGAESQVPSLPPAVQKALFIHLAQQQQQPQSQGEECHKMEGQDERNANQEEAINWYSSDEEGGTCVSSILKSLQKKKELHTLPPPTPTPVGDPRLQKERAPPSDPRQRPPDAKKEPEGAADPRLARDPRKLRPPDCQHGRKPPRTAGEEDEEGERELRERASLIPLEPRPGAPLKDPRCQLKQFSHIRVDVVLQRPAFAHTVVWAPEDLIPLLVPKQEHSINLPLPPLIADAQLQRSNQPPHHHHHLHHLPVTTPPHIDPRLAAARLKEGVSRPPPRPLDPRQHKALDPRIKRAGSLDSKPPAPKEASRSPGAGGGGGAVDPRLQRAGAGTSESLPPYAPRLASSGAGLESPTTILGGISLYDPRQQAQQAPKKTGILKQPSNKDSTASSSPPQRRGSSDEVKGADGPSDGAAHQPPPPAAAAPVSPLKPPALHNLPVQTVAGLIRTQYADPRQAKLGGQGSVGPQEESEESKEPEEEQVMEEEPKQDTEEVADDRTLKDVFKTFDPTASPFFQ